VNTTLARASFRHMIRNPWQALLAVLGIALGVAVVTAIDLTEASARASFQDAAESIVGRATHQIVGGPRGLDEGVYTRLRLSGRVDTLAPVIEASLRLPNHGMVSLKILGVDPIVEAPLRGYWATPGDNETSVTALITQPGTVLVSKAVADRMQLAPGDQLVVEHGGARSRLEIIGVLDPEGGVPALAGSELVVADIATAQEILGMAGRLSRIDLILPTGAGGADVRTLLTGNTELVTSESRIRAVASMTRAFHTNLAALSLLALLVGMFLIYNSQTFMVIQRREQFGILRALGVQQRQVALMVLGEAAAVGVIGSIAGLVLGTLLAGGLIGLVTQTINDLYFTLARAEVRLDSMSLLKGFALGVGGSILATLIPAHEATRVEPRAAMSRAELEGRASAAVGMAARAGGAVIAAGMILFLIPGPRLVWGFIGLFLAIVGSALISPWLTVMFTRSLQRSLVVRRRLSARLAVRGVNAAISRTGVAVAALMLAVATTIGVGIMVDSFRMSVSDWLSSVLRADYYATLASSLTPGATGGLSTDMLEQIGTIPGVRDLSHVRRVSLASQDGFEQLAVYQLNTEGRAGFRFIHSVEPERLWNQFEAGDMVLVSESYAYHRDIVPGSRVSLRSDKGYRLFEVGGIYQDYSSDRGIVAMSRATYDRYWSDQGVSGIGIYSEPDFDLTTFKKHMVKLVGPGLDIDIVSNREIREESLRVFDRTFTITEVLRWLAGIIAFIGVFSALMAIQLERSRELGILKALGFTPRQIRTVVVGETAIIGTAAGLIAIPVGFGMAALLIFVINRRSFGWSMAIDPELSVFAGGLVLALVAALLAGIYPAARMAGAQPAEVLRSE